MSDKQKLTALINEMETALKSIDCDTPDSGPGLQIAADLYLDINAALKRADDRAGEL